MILLIMMTIIMLILFDRFCQCVLVALGKLHSAFVTKSFILFGQLVFRIISSLPLPLLLLLSSLLLSVAVVVVAAVAVAVMVPVAVVVAVVVAVAVAVAVAVVVAVVVCCCLFDVLQVLAST